jgi:hypothetical protein
VRGAGSTVKLHGAFAVGVTALLAACAKSTPPSPAVAHPTTPGEQPGAVATAAAEQEVHGQGHNGQFKESAVYVDGKPIAVLRYNELPASLKPHAVPEISSLGVARFFSLVEYLQALHVDPARVQAIQLYGSRRRVATIEGSELGQLKGRLFFDFTQQDQGKPRTRWTSQGMKHSTTIDVINSVAIYVDKTAPTYTPGEGLSLDGKPVDGIPYATDDEPKGTRVYVDGALAGWVKRKLLTDDLIAKGSARSHAHFSLSAFLGALHVDATHAKAVDFTASDAMIARYSAKDFLAHKDDFVFSTPRHSHGRVLELFPGDKSAKISSVQIYVRTSPPSRPIDPEAFEDESGSSADQNGSQVAGELGGNDPARNQQDDD